MVKSDLEMGKNNLGKLEKTFSILGNEVRLKILYLLLQNEPKKFNFNEIAEKTSIKKNKLAYHIALLKNNQFINNEIRAEKNNRTFSYYTISNKGKRILRFIEKMDKDMEENEEALEKILQ
ncbi:MAG: ArsR/SmtB family transcription factor [Promethearchaeota archaeon]